MIAVIVLLDQLVWRPIITWADKFKFEQVESASVTSNTLLSLIGRASLVIRGYRLVFRPIISLLTPTFATGARRAAGGLPGPKKERLPPWLLGILAATRVVGLGL